MHQTYTHHVPAEQFYGIARGKAKPKPKKKTGVDITKVTLEQQTKIGSEGRGRGCSIEGAAGYVLYSSFVMQLCFNFEFTNF